MHTSERLKGGEVRAVLDNKTLYQKLLSFLLLKIFFEIVKLQSCVLLAEGVIPCYCVACDGTLLEV